MTELLNTLYVQTQGAALYLEGDSVRIVIPDDARRRTLPLRRLQEIVAFGNIELSTPLLARCATDGRPVTRMTAGGRFLFRVKGPVQGNVLLRHAQHLVYADADHRLRIAQAVIAGKVQNSRQFLLRGARDATDHQGELRAIAERLGQALPSIPAAEDLDQLRGIEGSAGRDYFQAYSLMLRSGLDVGPFTSRTRRPPTDPINALMGFLYGLVRSLVHGANEQVGLDPYVGFLHGLRPGKPALALDLMEELRALLADRLALTLLNRRQLRGEHFDELPGGAVQLTEDGRKIVLTEWQEWKKREWPHRLLGRRVPAALLPSVQSRILARHLRGELPAYMPWAP
ncbi:type I-C CRISPR-associated endonuclease Cas1c [Actinomadura syzygii]|uniref:CRISPR-associated endonuclease Cas1 n=1 Tax=Actinomadura syzygii TaxID=1427538 RepID=A0A5D0TWL8_9ACTN|nr:type I-C CRISPR-associated endonuclease Cas1c [Actinomadura syzygii]TYC10063.1 type I-C CRISPR-associated endonuclease Cas1 [Actinomadura syzygii]